MGHLRIQHQSKEPQNTIAKVLAPGGGIEPPLTDSKSAVLPLDDPGLRHKPYVFARIHRE